MNTFLLPLLFLVVGALAAWLITHFVARNNTAHRLKNNDRLWNERLLAQQNLAEQAQKNAEEKLTFLKARSEKEMADSIEQSEKTIAELKQQYEKNLKELKETHARMIKDLNEQHGKTLNEQISTLKTEMKAETEAILKAREEELSKGNRTNIDAILSPLKESIKNMQKAMESNALEHVKSNTELRSQLRQAVKEMQERTTDIGSKADNLSQALTGKAKMQGCWGENLLDSILQQEGLIKGKHYTREEVNEDRTRPDFLFHFRENGIDKDLIVDSKVSLTAFTSYMNAGDPDEKEKYLTEHIRSIRKHIDELSGKDYARRIDPERRFAGYVLMFMPIDMAMRVALDKEPLLWQEAYEKNVVIVTEQTVTPFLKIIELTWNRAMQEDNNREIMKAAEEMIERVGQFYDSYRNLGEKLRGVCNEYNEGIKKLREKGYSITTSANKIVRIGIRREKNKKLAAPTKVLDYNEKNTTLQEDVYDEAMDDYDNDSTGSSDDKRLPPPSPESDNSNETE